MTAPEISLLSEPARTPVVELWRPTLDAALPTVLDHAAVTWRHPAQRAKWELAAASLRGFRRTLDAEGFTEIQTPKLVDSVTESGANVFPVDYFGTTAYLAQSPQFFKQQLVGVFERVYETGPVFPRGTARHGGVISPSTSPSTPSSASSATTAMCSRCCTGCCSA